MPLGYDEKIFYLRKRKKNKKFNISYFGRIKYDKGIHILIKSLKDVSNASQYQKYLTKKAFGNMIFSLIKMFWIQDQKQN